MNQAHGVLLRVALIIEGKVVHLVIFLDKMDVDAFLDLIGQVCVVCEAAVCTCARTQRKCSSASASAPPRLPRGMLAAGSGLESTEQHGYLA